MSISVDCVKTTQAGIEYYVAAVPFPVVCQLIKKASANVNLNKSPETLFQRDLSNKRAAQMAEYLTRQKHFYPPILIELVTDKPKFVPYSQSHSNGRVGKLHIHDSDTIIVVDGQHRLKSIEIAMERGAPILNDEIVMVIRRYSNIIDTQTLFADVNRNAKPIPRSLAIQMDHNHDASILARYVADNSPYLAGRVHRGTSKIRTVDGTLISLSGLERATQPLLLVFGNDKNKHLEFWNKVFSRVPILARVASGAVSASFVRKNTLLAGSSFFVGVANAVAQSQQLGIATDKIIEAVGTINWSKTSPDFAPIRTERDDLHITGHKGEEYYTKLIVDRARQLVGASQKPSE